MSVKMNKNSQKKKKQISVSLHQVYGYIFYKKTNSRDDKIENIIIKE